MRRGRPAGAALVAVLLPVLAAVATPAAGARPTPGVVFVTTSPALAGVHLAVGPALVTTGPGGRASVRVADFNGIASRVSLADRHLGVRHVLRLAFVSPAPHTARYESHLTVGLDVTSLVRLRVDPGSTGAGRRDVRAVRLHSVTGETRLVDPSRTASVRLLSRKARRPGSTAPGAVTWTVDSLRSGDGSTFATSRTPFDPFRGGTWRLQLRPVAGTVVVDTVPATSGVTFVLDGASFTTDAHGHATSAIADLNGVDLRLRASSPQADGVSVSVARVARLAPTAPFQRHLLVALAVRRPVTLRFADPTGRAVPASRVSEVRLDGGGETVRVSGDQLAEPVPLLASIGRLADGVWTPQPVTYAVTRVEVEGANAVFSGQQRLDPGSRPAPMIAVSVFDLHVTLRDAVFGRRVASTAYVVRPDGAGSRLQIGSGRPTVIRSLVRGEYVLTTHRAVVGSDTTLQVSKTSAVDLRVVTLLDAAVLTVLVLGPATGLVLLGLGLRRRSAQSSRVPG